jgi:hypothetical protein
MLQSFFIGYVKLLERQKNSILRYTQTFCPLVLISIRIIENILPQTIKINLALTKPLRFTMDVLNPARHAGYANIKPGRHPGYRKSFFLSDRQDFTAEIQSICHL